MAIVAYPSSGQILQDQICAALGLDPMCVRRIVLDLNTGEPVMAYVEMIADKRILDVRWDLASGAVISRGK